ncbi:hypothetical protein RQP46_009463 [Phenoliferia psychrophenolica]
MSVPNTSRTWVLQTPPLDGVDDQTWVEEVRPIPQLKANEVLVRVSHLSNDPAQRGWMQADATAGRLYVVPIVKGDAMRSHAMGVVVLSTSTKFAVGDRVMGSMYWSECIMPSHTSPTLPMSVFGGTWMAAYFGLHAAGEVKAGQSVLVSGAAGATGGAVIQIAKHLVGCSRIVGIAGGADKCRFVVDVLGADQCLDYKSPTFKDDLMAVEEFDLYFDNVGGAILDAALLKVKRHGRVSLCGAISSYNDRSQSTYYNWFETISQRITLKGFISSDHATDHPAAKQRILAAIVAKKLVVEGIETIVKAPFEKIPSVWMELFKGTNQGKLLTELISEM